MSDVLTDILAKRRDRAIAKILGFKERELDPILSQHPRGREVSTKLRKIVLDELNDQHELALDVLKSLGDDSTVVLNDHYLKLLANMHDTLAEVAEHVMTTNGAS